MQTCGLQAQTGCACAAPHLMWCARAPVSYPAPCRLQRHTPAHHTTSVCSLTRPACCAALAPPDRCTTMRTTAWPATVLRRYELYLSQQWERREALVAMGNLSGVFKVLVKYVGGVPTVLLDFAKVGDGRGRGGVS